MKVSWVQDGCFILESSYQKKIILNPNEKYLNNCDFCFESIFLYPTTNIDIKIPQNYLAKITIVNTTYTFKDNRISITNFKSYRDNILGLKRGENFIYKIDLDGLKLVHLGLLGEIPEKSILNSIKDADILFIPIGGNICISGEIASKLINYLTPKFIIPMYYKVSSNKFYLDSLHQFIITQKNIIRLNSSFLHTSDLNNFAPNSTIILKP